jgi:sulfate transport system substrate-binding protein
LSIPPFTSAVLVLALLAGACGENSEVVPHVAPSATRVPSSTGTIAKERVLTVAGFSLAREPYASRIVGDFESRWRAAHAEPLRVVASYGGSGSQAQAVLDGLEADVVAFSVDEDIERLARAGLVRSDWRTASATTIVARSIVVITVRKGNPLGIHEWVDLARPGLRIVTPDPRTSGAGRWNVCAIYGAALRGEAGVPPREPASAERFLASVLRNVVEQAADAESSFRSFGNGHGDVAIAAESQVQGGRMFGNDYEAVIPRSSLRIDNPVAVVDANVEKHGVRQIAEAFRDSLASPDAQRAFAFYGFRPVDAWIARECAGQFPTPPDLWTIDELGGWIRVTRELFDPGGAYERASTPVTR